MARTRLARRALIVAALALTIVAAALPVSAAPRTSPAQLQVELTVAGRDGLKPRIANTKPARTEDRAGLSQKILQVKFRERSLVRLRNGRLTSLGSDDLTGVGAVAAKYPGIRFVRMFDQPELQIAAQRARIERASKEEMPDLNLWYKAYLPPGARAAKVSDELNGLAIVEIAYPESLPEVDPGITLDYTDRQDYKNPAGEGIGTDAAYSLFGGKGNYVRIYDIEYDWNFDHEDLDKAGAPGAFIQNGTPVTPFTNNHGTAVIGELVADNNAFGVTGIAYDSGLRMINSRNTGGDGRAAAIQLAHNDAYVGDVVLLEMQTGGPNGSCLDDSQIGCVPVETVASIYDVIKLTTADNIYVVEAAGNGQQDLDGPEYATWRNKGLSGAMIVGAGGSSCGTGDDLRERLSFSNHGGMVTMQGWGECVTTTGYGYLQGASESNDAYTAGFGGTSSASPIVAGAVALYSSVYQSRNGINTSPGTGVVHYIMAVTATAQQNETGDNIGGLPDLRRALRVYDNVDPALPALALSDQTTNSLTHTDGPIYTVMTGTDNFEVEEYYVSESPVTPVENAAGWTDDNTSTFGLSGSDGLKTLYAWTKDTNDNISPRAETTIVLDSVDPTLTLAAPLSTNKRKIDIEIVGSDASSGVQSYLVRAQNGTTPTENDPGWQPLAPAQYTFTGTSGVKNLYAWVKDNAGNISSKALKTLLFDNKKPVVSIDQPVGGSALDSLKKLRGKAMDNLPPQYRRADFAIGKRLGGGQCAFWNPIQHKLVNGPCNAPKRFLIKTAGNVPNWQRNIGTLDTPGKYFVVVRFTDGAGNIGKQQTVFRITAATGTPPGFVDGQR